MDRTQTGVCSGLLTRKVDGFDPLPVLQICPRGSLVGASRCQREVGGFDPRLGRHILASGFWCLVS